MILFILHNQNFKNYNFKINYLFFTNLEFDLFLKKVCSSTFL
jgi:hypothetical protein